MGSKSSADLLSKVSGTFFTSPLTSAPAQILAFSSAGNRTRSIRNPHRRSCSSPVIPPYSGPLDHFHPSGLFTRPPRTRLKWMVSPWLWYSFTGVSLSAPRWTRKNSGPQETAGEGATPDQSSPGGVLQQPATKDKRGVD